MNDTNLNDTIVNDGQKDDQKNETEDIPSSSHPRSRGALVSLILFLAIVFSSIFGALFGFMAGTVGQKILPGRFGLHFNTGNNSGSNEIVKQQLVQEDSAVTDVVQKTSPAVVSIVATADASQAQGFFDVPGFFGNPGSGSGQQKVSSGTGFFITNDGMIVTNKHVVADTGVNYTVITSDNKQYKAKVLARDPVNDIAIIKVDGSNFSTLNFGNTDDLKVGQTVIAIGNSLGEFSNTVSRGIVSGLKRNVTAGSGFGDTERLSNIIQTDAAINPGNSGGPLINLSGNVIGINVAVAEGAQNIGFAIPGNQVQRVVEQVKSTGKISIPYIGVRFIPIDATIQQENNLPYNYGALVLRGQNMSDLAVIPGSPADKAGITENDIILEVNGTHIDDKNSLTDLIAQHNIGDQVMLKVWHKGETKDVQVTLEERT